MSFYDTYCAAKQQHHDSILIIRVGDFYEAFDEDAKILSKTCDIVLASRPIGKNKRVHMAGFPWYAADSYIRELIEAGHKVAVAENPET